MIRKSAPFVLFLTLFVLLVTLWSCRKTEDPDTSPSLKLSFSTDTVLFDTVFTTVGSVTKRLMVYNNNDSRVNISSIRMGSGGQSNFRINIDGQPVASADNIEIAANDSMFIFVNITVDPTQQNLPVVISDSIVFTTNGNLQDVNLVAWGQDAVFHNEEDLSGAQVWDSLKPHVIYGHLRVDTSGTLTIREGTKVYFHKNAYLTVSSDASLKVLGTIDHPVSFRSDRLDPYYRDLPGQWRGIWLEKGSRDHEILNAVIRNGENGLIVDSSANAGVPMLHLNNVIIQNMTYNGIYAYATSITAENLVIGNCGISALTIEYGGSYDFRQLTVANYWSGSVRTTPSVYLSNYTYFGNTKSFLPLTKAYFGNAIIYGSSDEEIELSLDPAVQGEYTFDHALLSTQISFTDPNRFISCERNKDPMFVNPVALDFRIDSLSPAIDKGIPMGVPFDIKGSDRGAAPDLGAYEYVGTSMR